MPSQETVVQGSLFEEDYLLRSLGNIVRDPEYALTELVANAWDAGATEVKITIPKEDNGVIRVLDNGHGLTPTDFKQRWMKLGYNRLKHQGVAVEFPPDVTGAKRKAYGRNGIGRHGMFCFSTLYTVKTRKGGIETCFDVGLSSGEHPFIITSEMSQNSVGHGTSIEAQINRNRPDADAMRESISARFIHDPRFVVSVNGKALSLALHPGAEAPITLDVPECGQLEVIIVDSLKSARTKQKQGFAFWVENRLVGDQSWTLGSNAPVDARTTFGRRFTVLVKCDCMESEIEPDWSGFRKGQKRNALFKVLADFITSKYQEFSKEKIDETKRHAFEDNLAAIRPLNGSARAEVACFVEAVVEKEPTIKPETLSTAIQAVINLQQTRSGQRLLERLAGLGGDDVEALDRLLAEWTAQDALTVLDELDHRISTIRAIEILSNKKDTDELHTLHPLVTSARWLFGPEFESSEYASNLSLKNAVNKVFEVNSLPADYPNWRKRADLLLLADASISAVALDEIEMQTGLSRIRRVLLLELKKGDSKIGRKEMNQAEEYVDAIKNSDCISGHFHIDAFVIGARVDGTVSLDKELKANDVRYASIKGVCFADLTQTATKRLFRLKERLEDRYAAVSQSNRSKLLDDLLSQQTLDLTPNHSLERAAESQVPEQPE